MIVNAWPFPGIRLLRLLLSSDAVFSAIPFSDEEKMEQMIPSL